MHVDFVLFVISCKLKENKPNPKGGGGGGKLNPREGAKKQPFPPEINNPVYGNNVYNLCC